MMIVYLDTTIGMKGGVCCCYTLVCTLVCTSAELDLALLFQSCGNNSGYYGTPPASVSLQASFDPPQAAKFDPYTPRINLDSPNVKLSKDIATSLNQFLTESFKLPLDARLQRLKTAGMLNTTTVGH